MRMAFVGKGGSGKTTLCSMMVRYAQQKGLPLLAIDADINQHLGEAVFGADYQSQKPDLGTELAQLKTLLLGKSTVLNSTSEMVKTMLPTQGSHLVTLSESDAVLSTFAEKFDKPNQHFMHVGGFDETDIGTKCFHAKTGAVELVLNHLVDDQNDVVAVDMTAGADAFASGLFTRFDVTFIVVEPTLKSLSVYKQYKEYAKDYPLTIKVIGNKIADADDLEFLQAHCGDDLIGTVTHSKWVKRAEKGLPQVMADLEPQNAETLERALSFLQNQKRDWTQYWDMGAEFHTKNAVSWANEAAGRDVASLIDMDFLLSLNAAKAA